MRTITLGAILVALTFAMPNAAAVILPISLPIPGTWTAQNAEWGVAPAGGEGLALRMDLSGGSAPFGFVSMVMPAGVEVGDLTALSLDTYFEAGGCGGGSPRIQLAIDEDGDGASDGNVFVYAGPFPNFAGCATGAWTANDLLDGAKRFDSTQFGGPFYGTQADAQSALGAGHSIVRIVAVYDSTWLFDPAVVWFDDITVQCLTLGEPLDSVVTIVEAVSGVCLPV